MLVSSSNLNTLFIMLVESKNFNATFEKKGDVTRIFEADKTIGYNFANFAELPNGPVFLNQTQIDELNQKITNAGFVDLLEVDKEVKFVIGKVIEIKPHPNSDHLNLVTVDLKTNQKQLVSGSPNMKTDIKVVVVQPGAIMPSGQVIFGGSLRGVESNGMIASARELRLNNAPDQPGALILPDDFGEVGDPFDFEKGNQLL